MLNFLLSLYFLFYSGFLIAQTEHSNNLQKIESLQKENDSLHSELRTLKHRARKAVVELRNQIKELQEKK